ncbi:hypothetical protein phi16_gp075 [Corynebacterium phage phi16]|uniref:hypothetical protein n=1 Tax=Corynebacterium glutamicum TaxID=1718 RepID=UPI000944DD7A|nr:hypothetical protein [Corynebacterium glutamicum]APQ42578.1 hypothetical protein phi16_gp075 [Corynebacterium phage phi16]OKX80519.1 hypothetical protein AUO95_10255 [Corynebacterium glutamicum]
MSDVISQVNDAAKKAQARRDREIGLSIEDMVHKLSEEVHVYGVQALVGSEWRSVTAMLHLAVDPLDGKWFPTADEAIEFQEAIDLKRATRLCRRRVSPIEMFVPGAEEGV